MADGGGVHQVPPKARRADGEGRTGSRGDGQAQGDGGKSFLHVEVPVLGSAGFRFARLQAIDASVHASVAFMRTLYTSVFAGLLSRSVKFYEI
jgi:hypothetical protein